MELTTYLGKIKEILLSLVLYHMDTGREDQQCKIGTVTLKSRNRIREKKREQREQRKQILIGKTSRKTKKEVTQEGREDKMR